MTPETPTLAALRAARGAGRRRPKRNTGRTCVAAYLRVSGDEQKVTGLGLEAQEAEIRAECEQRGLTLCGVFQDAGVSGSIPPDKRPGLRAAIAALDKGEAGTLMVAKVDRLTRSLSDLLLLSTLGERAGWDIVALNTKFDTTTPQGRMMRNMLGSFAELEAAMGSERMKAAAAVRRARGETLGRPSQVSRAARDRIAELRAEGLSWAAVADRMNAEGYSTSQGGAWHPTQAQRAAALSAT